MNQNESKFFSKSELSRYDATSLPFIYLLKSAYIQIRRKLWGKFFDKDARMVWTIDAVSDAVGPADNVRNYLERRTLRSVLSEVTKNGPIASACEVGCGYGRLIMVLKEYASKVVGFEREGHLLDVAKSLLPDIVFCQCDSLNMVDQRKLGPFDFAMTWTVLQHLTDEDCQAVITAIKHLVPNGYILISEKTQAVAVTQNVTEGRQFISRARSVETYKDWMKPYTLVKILNTSVENTYHNKTPGTCMLFKR
ncbi:MAG: class I SAM-dependent methyltransferase [Candidatus Omnitrophica bacterium]|nr:class I SAM-dependent methyltransferase [Candidatus Omnitrophota bacterium]